MSLPDYEKLGEFYLGRIFDTAAGAPTDELLLYDSRDLTTHAVCVGMTGSGKTGLCLALLEEAAIDGIPAIAIDPKGDLGNLCLTFPQLRPADFRPWLEEREAARQGLTDEAYAAQIAERWQAGLATWGQNGDRIARFRDAVDLAIYTPGSSAGLGLTVLQSFAAPPAELVQDAELLQQRIAAATAGLLGLVGIDADPLQSREHILIANVLDYAWRQHQDLDVSQLIRQIQAPPFTKVGVFDLDTFFPPRERQTLAMRINGLLASPAFAGWMSGEPLNVERLLHTPEGRPRLSIISIAHLSDPERMFFVTQLLNEILVWLRGQKGTSSLRALLYMDEIYGYFPPSANPPSKTPMLTLLKQARAYGLGIVLATQNPVDLDYKGLANTGTWFLGRLQTERDKLRILDGLEGASAQGGAAFDRRSIERLLSGLNNRVFLMNNVHEERPVVFQTRWALSYLRGPLARPQIETLMRERKQAAEPGAAPARPPATATPPTAGATTAAAPVLPTEIRQQYLVPRSDAAGLGPWRYRPALWAQARVHFVAAKYGVDQWQDLQLLVPLNGAPDASLWDSAESITQRPTTTDQPAAGTASYDELPAVFHRAAAYKTATTRLKDFLYRSQSARVWHCPPLKAFSPLNQSQGEFRVEISRLAHDARDRGKAQLEQKYAAKFRALEDRRWTAAQRVAREKAEAQQEALQTAVNVGSTFLGALFGRKKLRSTQVTRASRSVRDLGRASQQQGDVDRAEERVEVLDQQLRELDQQFQSELRNLAEACEVQRLPLEECLIRPRKSDIMVDGLTLVWLPWVEDPAGQLTPAF